MIIDHFLPITPTARTCKQPKKSKTTMMRLIWVDESMQHHQEYTLVYQLTTSRHCESTPGGPGGLSQNRLPPIQWRITIFPHCNGLVGAQFSEEPILRWITSLQWWWKHKTQHETQFTGGSSLHVSKLQKKKATDSGYTSCADEHISKSCWWYPTIFQSHWHPINIPLNSRMFLLNPH